MKIKFAWPKDFRYCRIQFFEEISEYPVLLSDTKRTRTMGSGGLPPAPKAVAQATHRALAGSRGEAPGKNQVFNEFINRNCIRIKFRSIGPTGNLRLLDDPILILFYRFPI